MKSLSILILVLFRPLVVPNVPNLKELLLFKQTHMHGENVCKKKAAIYTKLLYFLEKMRKIFHFAHQGRVFEGS